jgi:hypothetical protein
MSQVLTNSNNLFSATHQPLPQLPAEADPNRNLDDDFNEVPVTQNGELVMYLVFPM